MRSIPKFFLVMTLTTAFAACITVNIYFPAPQVRAAAEEIVEETWGEQGTTGSPAEPQSAPQPSASGPGALLDLFGARNAWAEDHPDVEVSTAAIRALKATMKQRAEELKPYLAKGQVGIHNDGMLEAVDTSGLPLAEQAKVRRLVEAENRDRKALYGEIAEANGYSRAQIKDIQDIFAQTWIDKAERGWPIQKPDGSWTKK